MNKKLLAIAGVLIALGIILFVLPTPGEPDLVCTSQSSPSSGFTDEDQGGCPISIESFKEYSDWESSPKIDNIAGLVLVVGGVALAGVARFKKPKRTS